MSDIRATERRNPRTADIDLASPSEIVSIINAEDQLVSEAVASQSAHIAKAITIAEESFRDGGRLFYIGAGTSGRLGVLDASECPPTFGTDPSMVQGIIAGGLPALIRSQEGAEDDRNAGADAMDDRSIGARDFVIGIAASGTTPYVAAALEQASVLGAKTAIVACSPPPDNILSLVDVAIVVLVGPEVVTGSTRMKAGTATKLVLNTITTGAMIRIGKTYGNLMVDLRATNAKLTDRAERIVMEVCELPREQARTLLDAAGRSVKTAITMHLLSIGRIEAERRLHQRGGVIRNVVQNIAPPPSMRGSDPCYVGAMSGTSLDGITCAVVRFEEEETSGTLSHDLIGFTVQAYTPVQRTRLAAAMQGATPEEYCRLNFDLGEWIASAVQQAIAGAGVARSEIRAIGSHGQTLWHVPGHSTWQMGEPAVIAERTGIDVVSDFRVRDVAAGGQGAPLVPMADAVLYASDRWRLLHNIGGMANVTIVPPGGDVRGVRAFDTGPGVAVIDAIVRALYPDMSYDVDGAIAALGTSDDSVVHELMKDPYFAQDPPKSTGREHFGDAYAARVMALCAQRGGSHEDMVATAVALTVTSMAEAYRRFVPEPAEDILVSGGGANNQTLVEMLARAVGARRVVPFEDVYYDGEAKESVAFALLAHLHCMRQPGNVIGATGARAPRVLGMLTPA